MKVISKLRIDGNESAFLIEDESVVYPIFKESLHIKNIFDQLIASGYKFCGLPYNFKKDGISIESLPSKEYVPTDDEMQDMFDMNSLPKMDTVELNSRLSKDDITYIPTLPGNYTINTREEFLAYLKNTQVMNNDDDFKPINSFVHPCALFTVDEWRSGEYTEYFRIMEARRILPYRKFRKLRDWLVSIGMDANGDAIDIVEMYNMWGLDGLNVQFISKQRKTETVYDDFISQPGMEPDAYEIVRVEDALVDKYGAIYPPLDVPAGYNGWQVAYQRGKESTAFRSKLSSLRADEYGVVKVRTKVTEDVLIYSTLTDTFRVTPHKVTCGDMVMHNFSVKMPDIVSKTLSSNWWSAKHDTRVKEMSYLYAMASMMLEQRRYTADVSTYKALMKIGCDAYGALQYVVDKMTDKYNSRVEEAEDDESATEIPRYEDIQMYVDGEAENGELSEETQVRMDSLKDIVNGVTNLDGVASGIRADASLDVDEIYRYLYCAHFCKPQVSLDEIYRKLHNVVDSITMLENVRGETNPVVQFVTEPYNVNVPCPEIKGKVSGYTADLRWYKTKQAKECCGFLKVIQIAKEYGAPTCKRHVAFEALAVNLIVNKGIAKRNLEQLMDIFEEQLVENVPLAKQSGLRQYKLATCMSEYFRVAEEGVMKCPIEIGGKTITISTDLVMSIRSTITHKITSTAMYCRKMYENGYMTHFCVNAEITPFYICPRPWCKIPAASLPALWYDWASQGAPQIASKLLNDGCVYRGFIAWNMRYLEQHYFDTSEFPQLNLVKYMKYCNDFRANVKEYEVFEHAPHIESLLYGMYPDETVLDDNGSPLRQKGEVPAITISQGEIVTSDTFPEHGNIQIQHGKSIKQLRRFEGFDADDYYLIDSVLTTEMPKVSEKYISIDGDTISTDSQENVSIYELDKLIAMGYAVIKLRAGKYILRDLLGNLWEAFV